jgi:tetratricopeptide (TPR) repeat protein
LSQKYRFSEGSAYQRRAVAFDSNFLPARIQLAQDLLRLGDEAEGWQLAEGVHQRDGYDVTAYNLVTLRRSMQKFATITNEDFILRMSPHEAAVYGERAMALLQKGKAQLSAKYGIEIAKPTIIEIFPDQKDFAVRTFGMPGNPGYLGVCFGRVVTANSPASGVGDRSNWEAVLWHEFCHVITLQLTKNKMPRWLSEGISVYEERQANPAWGEKMNPRYREMVLGEDLTPVSELSAAFLSPKSSLHVQFAYYESSLVVEFLIEKFGFEKLKALLRDLATGTEINDSIPKHMAPMEQVEKDFEAYAKARAEAFGPGLNWTKAKTGRITNFEELVDSAKAKAEEKPDAPNYWKLLEEARKLVADRKWEEAKAPLKKLIELCPDQIGGDNAYALLAAAHHGLNETNDERAVLEKWAAKDGDAVEAFLRLSELAESAKDWKATVQNAERFLAVNPLVPQPYRFLGRASEELGETKPAIGAYENLLRLDPADPAEVHFRLATLLHKENDPTAKRHVLQALEEAPRYREAHRLLLELAAEKPDGTKVTPTAPAAPTPAPFK